MKNQPNQPKQHSDPQSYHRQALPESALTTKLQNTTALERSREQCPDRSKDKKTIGDITHRVVDQRRVPAPMGDVGDTARQSAARAGEVKDPVERTQDESKAICGEDC